MKTVIIFFIILLSPFVMYVVEYDIRESTVSAKQDWQKTGVRLSYRNYFAADLRR